MDYVLFLTILFPIPFDVNPIPSATNPFIPVNESQFPYILFIQITV